MSHITLTKETFQQEVLESTMPVLVDFWAVWCGPCKMTEPIVDELAKEYEGKVKIGKLNVDEAPELSSQYSVLSIPTFLMFKDGKPVSSLIGVQSKTAFEQQIKDAL